MGRRKFARVVLRQSRRAPSVALAAWRRRAGRQVGRLKQQRSFVSIRVAIRPAFTRVRGAFRGRAACRGSPVAFAKCRLGYMSRRDAASHPKASFEWSHSTPTVFRPRWDNSRATPPMRRVRAKNCSSGTQSSLPPRQRSLMEAVGKGALASLDPLLPDSPLSSSLNVDPTAVRFPVVCLFVSPVGFLCPPFIP